MSIWWKLLFNALHNSIGVYYGNLPTDRVFKHVKFGVDSQDGRKIYLITLIRKLCYNNIGENTDSLVVFTKYVVVYRNVLGVISMRNVWFDDEIYRLAREITIIGKN